MAPLTLALFGAPLDSGNRGVEALGRAVLQSISRTRPGSRVIVFDNGWGVRDGSFSPNLPTGVTVEFCGVRKSRRWHRRESWANASMSARLGGLGSHVVDLLRETDAVLDISGGDSFSDLYGPGRFDTVMRPKRIAETLNKPLALLPQTYGPFRDEKLRSEARAVIAAAATAWARDERSFARLRALLEDDFDRRRHRSGVDVAFALEPRQPLSLPTPLESALESDTPLVGVNVSGLLATSPPDSLQFDYLAAMRYFVTQLLERGVRVALVPHVRTRGGSGESDANACEAVRDALGDSSAVFVVPDELDAEEVKWVISQTDWFCGSRMHATIAALSSMTPAVALAYSDKFEGVFDSAGLPENVLDARILTADQAVDGLLQAFENRRADGETLRRRVPHVRRAAEDQLKEILDQALERRGP